LSAQPQGPARSIHLTAAEAGDARSELAAEFQFAPEKPAVGQPGSQPGDLLVLPGAAGRHRLVVSLGKPGACTPEMARRAGGALGRWLAGSGAEQVDLDLDSLRRALVDQPGCDFEAISAALCEGVKLGAYRFERYKQRDEQGAVVTARLLSQESDDGIRTLAGRVEAVANAVLMARDLSHEPANVINPLTLAERADEVARRFQLKLRVVEEAELRQMGAGAILAVGQGSRTPPRLIVLEYPGDGETGSPADTGPVVLVGKAITFDTGGYSIKNTEGIVGMKYDKCGGVAVLAALQAAAELKLKTPLVGVIAAAENMISAEAYRPDDILTTLSGKTVEIVSTDAEGRLVLADALTFAQREYKPRALIDLATLTGGVLVALGRARAGLLSNDEALAGQLFEAGEKTFERVWRLPLDEDFTRAMQGDDADLKNSAGREGHCILGGAFIQEFVEEGLPWAHLDIAGVASTPKDLPYAAKGATGFGVRLLVEYLRDIQ
jgi:leucyl aminopeptidase